jgi:hypothetical protein
MPVPKLAERCLQLEYGIKPVIITMIEVEWGSRVKFHLLNSMEDPNKIGVIYVCCVELFGSWRDLSQQLHQYSVSHSFTWVITWVRQPSPLLPSIVLCNYDMVVSNSR